MINMQLMFCAKKAAKHAVQKFSVRTIFLTPLVIASQLMFTVGCSSDVTYVKETLSEEDLDRAASLCSDTISLNMDSLYAARDFYVYHDSILVVVNDKAQEGLSFLEFFHMDSITMIAEYFKYGNGHNELLSANVDLNGGVLFVNDYVKAQFAFLDIDSVLAAPDKYSVSPESHGVHGAPTVVPYGDRYITENPYCYCDECAGIEQGVEQGVPRFIVTNGKDTPLEGNDYDFNLRNVAADGRIICKPNGSKYVYASFGQSLVEFYDKDLNLIRMVEGPRKLNVQYNRFSMKGDSQEQITYKGEIPYCYLGYCCDDDNVFLMYIGSFFSGNNDIQSMTTYILKFDWNGNYIRGYKYGRYLSCISKGTEEDVFYATTITDDGLPSLLKLHIK